MTKKERKNLIYDAQEHIYDAIELIEEATKGLPSEANTKAYIIDHLSILKGEDHGFLDNSKNLDDVVKEIEEEA